jgi:hypothetical protein
MSEGTEAMYTSLGLGHHFDREQRSAEEDAQMQMVEQCQCMCCDVSRI